MSNREIAEALSHVEPLHYRARSLRAWWKASLEADGSALIFAIYADYHLARRLARLH